MLEIRNISKEFSGVKALDNINFSVEKGEFIAIIGASGSRKINTSSFNRRS